MDTSQGWLVYVRWQSGQRETIRCNDPNRLSHDNFWVMACVPVPRVVVVQRK